MLLHGDMIPHHSTPKHPLALPSHPTVVPSPAHNHQHLLGPVSTAPSPFPAAAWFSILRAQTLPLGKPQLVGGTPTPLLSAAGVQGCLLSPCIPHH